MTPADTQRHARLLERLARELRTLPDKPEETAASTLAALWHRAAGPALSTVAALQAPLPALDDAAAQRLDTLVDQRLAGTPLAHLTGRQRFMGLEMLAGPEALIPRHETELLATAALATLRRLAAEQPQPQVLDACTGSANVAAALAHAVPAARVWAGDLSEAALALAARNLAHLGLAQRVSLRAGDLLQPFDDLRGQVDLLTCNPPYISAARRAAMDAEIATHEPELAFDGGALGVRILQRLIKDAPAWLRPGGWLVFEIGAGQGRAVRQRLQAHGGYAEVDDLCDGAGEVRALRARVAP